MNTAAAFTVLNVALDSGERLPCLVETATWIPVRVATRWTVRYRRYRVQSSTLANNLRILAHVYRWARETTGCDLDDRLTRGETPRGGRLNPWQTVCDLMPAIRRWILGRSITSLQLLKTS